YHACAAPAHAAIAPTPPTAPPARRSAGSARPAAPPSCAPRPCVRLALHTGGDAGHGPAHLADALYDVLHRLAGFVGQARAAVDAFHRLARRFGAALRERAHLAGHHREAAALLSGARRLPRRV